MNNIIARWIPVAERLPAENCSCLVTFSCGSVDRADFTSNLQRVFEFFHAEEEVSPVPGWYVECGEPYILEDVTDDVVAWMPLPEPYKKEEKRILPYATVLSKVFGDDYEGIRRFSILNFGNPDTAFEDGWEVDEDTFTYFTKDTLNHFTYLKEEEK